MDERSIIKQFIAMLQSLGEEECFRALSVFIREPFFDNNVEFSTTKVWQDCLDLDGNGNDGLINSSKKTLVIRSIGISNVIIHGYKNQDGKYDASSIVYVIGLQSLGIPNEQFIEVEATDDVVLKHVEIACNIHSILTMRRNNAHDMLWPIVKNWIVLQKKSRRMVISMLCEMDDIQTIDNIVQHIPTNITFKKNWITNSLVSDTKLVCTFIINNSITHLRFSKGMNLFEILSKIKHNSDNHSFTLVQMIHRYKPFKVAFDVEESYRASDVFLYNKEYKTNLSQLLLQNIKTKDTYKINAIIMDYLDCGAILFSDIMQCVPSKDIKIRELVNCIEVLDVCGSNPFDYTNKQTIYKNIQHTIYGIDLYTRYFRKRKNVFFTFKGDYLDLFKNYSKFSQKKHNHLTLEQIRLTLIDEIIVKIGDTNVKKIASQLLHASTMQIWLFQIKAPLPKKTFLFDSYEKYELYSTLVVHLLKMVNLFRVFTLPADVFTCDAQKTWFVKKDAVLTQDTFQDLCVRNKFKKLYHLIINMYTLSPNSGNNKNSETNKCLEFMNQLFEQNPCKFLLLRKHDSRFDIMNYVKQLSFFEHSSIQDLIQFYTLDCSARIKIKSTTVFKVCDLQMASFIVSLSDVICASHNCVHDTHVHMDTNHIQIYKNQTRKYNINQMQVLQKLCRKSVLQSLHWPLSLFDGIYDRAFLLIRNNVAFPEYYGQCVDFLEAALNGTFSSFTSDDASVSILLENNKRKRHLFAGLDILADAIDKILS